MTTAKSIPFTTPPLAPPDPIFAVTTAFDNCNIEGKVSLGVGAYRDAFGDPLVLSCVVEAKRRLGEKAELWRHEYIPIGGIQSFLKNAQSLLFGQSILNDNSERLSSIQSLSGTGALNLFAKYARQFAVEKTILIPTPTWGNHRAIFTSCDLKVGTYTYLDPKSPRKPRIDFDTTLEELKAAPENTIVLFHLCAHNPTGVDFTPSQWQTLLALCKSRGLFPVFDNAYQGFATGNLDEDAYAVRKAVEMDVSFFACCSFSKNLGLYGERIGALHYYGENAAAVLSQLKLIARATYSSPPQFGAMIVDAVLSDGGLRANWEKELLLMSSRIKEMRELLRSELERLQSGSDWSHLTDQIGMFSYTGLSEAEVEFCAGRGVFMLKTGRISMAGLNHGNFRRVAQVMVDAIAAKNGAE